MPNWLKSASGWIKKEPDASQPIEHGYRRDLSPVNKEESLRRPGRNAGNDVFIDETVSADESEYEYEYAMSISELLYSTSSFYAIIVPG